MEPLSALSLAANVFAVVDFATRFVSIAHELNTSGQLREHGELTVVANDLANANQSLQNALTNDYSIESRELLDLGNRSIQIADELIALLNKINSRKTKLLPQRFQKTVVVMWNKEKVLETSNRLQRVRDELEFHIIVTLKARMQFVRRHRVCDTDKSDMQGDSKTYAQAQGARLDFLSYQAQNTLLGISNHARDSKHEARALMSKLDELESLSNTHHYELMGALAALIGNQPVDTGPSVSAQSQALHGPEQQTAESILRWLRFSSMTDRREGIESAHQNTFEWIFETGERSSLKADNENMIDVTELPEHTQDLDVSSDADSTASTDSDISSSASQGHRAQTGFVKWLEGGQGIFWITGKAGSGKSTLMKLIDDDKRTTDYLRIWSGDIPLLEASFYFWRSGTELQRSWKGLLQALLHEVISQRLDLACVAFPGFASLAHEPVLSELQAAFRRLLGNEGSAFRLCLFIDGLDEFEGTSADQSDMAAFFNSCVSSPDIKAVISSRPLVQFENAFKKFERVEVHDLTTSDIKRYVKERLRDHNQMCIMIETDPKAVHGLIEDISRAASGVFLWVRLVVRNIFDGLEHGDSIPQLRLRVDELPSDLNKLYAQMLSQVPGRYKTSFFRIVRLLQEWQCSSYKEPLGLLVLSLALENDPDYALQFPIGGLSITDAARRCDLIGVLVKSDCLGMVEVQPTGNWSDDNRTTFDKLWDHKCIEFSHRTVPEFLNQSRAWKDLVAGQRIFDPMLAIIRAMIVRLKTMSLDDTQLIGQPFWFAAYYEAMNCRTCLRELEEVERVSLYRYLSERATLVPHPEFRIGPYDCPEGRKDCLGWAICTRNELFVESRLQASGPEQLLKYLFTRLHDLKFTQKDVRMARLLLNKGASANEPWQGITPWQKALYYMWRLGERHETWDHKGGACLFEVCGMLLDHHADTQADIHIIVSSGWPEQLASTANRQHTSTVSYKACAVFQSTQSRIESIKNDVSLVDDRDMVMRFVEKFEALNRKFIRLSKGV